MHIWGHFITISMRRVRMEASGVFMFLLMAHLAPCIRSHQAEVGVIEDASTRVKNHINIAETSSSVSDIQGIHGPDAAGSPERSGQASNYVGPIRSVWGTSLLQVYGACFIALFLHIFMIPGSRRLHGAPCNHIFCV